MKIKREYWIMLGIVLLGIIAIVTLGCTTDQPIEEQQNIERIYNDSEKQELETVFETKHSEYLLKYDVFLNSNVFKSEFNGCKSDNKKMSVYFDEDFQKWVLYIAPPDGCIGNCIGTSIILKDIDEAISICESLQNPSITDRVGKEFTGCLINNRFRIYFSEDLDSWVFHDLHTGQMNTLTEATAKRMCKENAGIVE